jgi:hypothetical protein
VKTAPRATGALAGARWVGWRSAMMPLAEAQAPTIPATPAIEKNVEL